MDVAPTTKLYLLKGVPITNNYKDTLYFVDKTAQYNYFYSKRIQTYSDFTYQRVEKGVVRVALGAESCYACNYMMFQNSGFGTKWFYAFITKAEYINNSCTEITYEIDKVQTWWFDLQVKPCMVVRQHSTSDTLYSNCEAEPFTLDAKYANWEQPCEAGNTFVTVTTGHWNTVDGDWNTNYNYAVINNIPCALEIKYWDDTDQARRDMVTYLQTIIDHGYEQNIVAIYVASSFVGSTPNSGVTFYDNYGANKATLRQNAFQGYTPRNNKLYNYPFCKLVMRSPTSEREYAIEDFRSGTDTTQIDTCNFRLFAVTVPTPTLLMVPKNYRGESINYEQGLDITDFPYMPFTGNTYEMWSVQNNGGYAMNFLGQIAALGLSFADGDYVGKKIGKRQALQEGANWVGQNLNAMNKPDNVYGLTKGNIFSNMKINGYRLQCKTLDYWQAKQIDDYFHMYGYAQNKIMAPNIRARQRWTYVQTENCTLVGNAPSDDISFIEQCFNNGITWWSTPGEVGMYVLDNPVLT